MSGDEILIVIWRFVNWSSILCCYCNSKEVIFRKKKGQTTVAKANPMKASSNKRTLLQPCLFLSNILHRTSFDTMKGIAPEGWRPIEVLFWWSSVFYYWHIIILNLLFAPWVILGICFQFLKHYRQSTGKFCFIIP